MSITKTQTNVSVFGPTTPATSKDPARLREALTGRKETAAKKRRDRKHGQIAAHYKLLLSKVLSAFGAPDCAFDYVGKLLAVVGYDHTDKEEVELFDDAFARATMGATHKESKATRQTRIDRETNRLRKNRQRILDWQAKSDSPLLFEFDSRFNTKTGKRSANYRIYVAELIREIASDVEPGASARRIDQAAEVRSSAYLERFTGEARRLVTKQVQSPESELHRAATKAKNTIDRVISERGELAALEMWNAEFLSRFPGEKYAFLRDFQDTNSQETNGLTSATTETTVTTSDAAEIVHSSLEKRVNESDNQPTQNTPSAPSVSSPAVQDSSRQPKHLKLVTVGQSHDEFMAEIWPEQKAGADPGAGWRDQAITDKQREVLSRGGCFDFSITRGQASDRINELKASGALCDFLSLSELQSFDPKANGYSKKERRFCCPLCGGEKPLDGEHRSLSVNTSSGVYFCHRCNAGGIVREFLSDQAAQIPARAFPAPSPTPTKPDSDRWRKFVADAKPISNTPGAAYLEGRGISAEVAARAGVRFGTFWKASDEGDRPEPFAAVIFELIDREGQLVAAQARAITGDTKRTRGDKLQGVFEATPGAMNAARVAITEAPIDALALAAAGLPAVAICGKTGPEWLAEWLAGREVFTATDGDADGEKIAADLAALFEGLAVVRRLRPSGGKDWAEVAQRHGLDSIAEQIEVITGAAGSDEMHDCALVAGAYSSSKAT